MKLVVDNNLLEIPYDESTKKDIKSKAAEDYWGAFSIEKFATAGSLNYTHDDAKNWLTYLEQFHPKNFWFVDSGVQVWAYEEQYDKWLDTYGMDAVLAVYHSGHGGMDSQGTFHAPLGAAWDGRTDAFSTNMHLGNERAKYIFWSTCLSLRVLGGHNPIKTWYNANEGFRMLFGFETTSIDSPDYGKRFWDEWNRNNNSLSTAWLEASWKIYHNQSPSVVACGATAEEARNRVFNERYMSWTPVSKNFWHWRWYNASGTASRKANLKIPSELFIAELKPININEKFIKDFIKKTGLKIELPSEVPCSTDGRVIIKGNEITVSFKNGGEYDIKFKSPNLSNKTPLSADKAKDIALKTISKYGLNTYNVELVFDRIRLSMAAGANVESSTFENPYVTETLVQFKQIINGAPVITPGVGAIGISIDNDGNVTNIHNSLRQIKKLSNNPKTTVSNPSTGKTYDVKEYLDYEPKLEKEAQKLISTISANNNLTYTTVPEGTEIGYDIVGNSSSLVASRLIEVDFGSGYKKLYNVKTSIFN